MSDLSGLGGEFRMTLEITRAATGKVETVEVVCKPAKDEEESHSGGDALNDGA